MTHPAPQLLESLRTAAVIEKARKPLMEHTPTPNSTASTDSRVIPNLTAKRKGRIAAEGWVGDFAEVFGDDDTLTAEVVTRLNAHDELVAALQWILPLAERYLHDAPGDPDNAKLESARAVLVKVQA